MNEIINPYKAIPSANPTKIRERPKIESSSLIAPKAALAALATATPPPIPDRPVAKAAAI